MVYDCFSFFNELDLLELRLNELDPVIDKFVLVESTRTFQKKAKPLFYNENKDRFKDFHHKITHIIVDKFPTFWSKFRVPKPWDYDTHQKNQVSVALKGCKPDDVIIFSDLDEIPNPEKILAYKNIEGFKIFQQRHFYYYLNCVEVEPYDFTQYKWWYGPVMTHYKNFTSVHELRIQREINKHPQSIVIPDAGWHFAYIGGVEKIIQKIESYAHTEHNTSEFKEAERIKKIIESGQSLYGENMKCVFQRIDQSYPMYLQQNLEKFSWHVFEGGSII